MYSFIQGKFPNRDASVTYTHVAVFAENVWAPNGDGTARLVSQKSASRSFTSADAMLAHAATVLGGPCEIQGASVVVKTAEKPAKGK